MHLKQRSIIYSSKWYLIDMLNMPSITCLCLGILHVHESAYVKQCWNMFFQKVLLLRQRCDKAGVQKKQGNSHLSKKLSPPTTADIW